MMRWFSIVLLAALVSAVVSYDDTDVSLDTKDVSTRASLVGRYSCVAGGFTRYINLRRRFDYAIVYSNGFPSGRYCTTRTLVFSGAGTRTRYSCRYLPVTLRGGFITSGAGTIRYACPSRTCGNRSFLYYRNTRLSYHRVYSGSYSGGRFVCFIQAV